MALGRIFRRWPLRYIAERLYGPPEVFVGKDLSGNAYYEKNDPAGKWRPVRRVVPLPGHDEWEVPEIPTEWQEWLRRRREDPPTLEELLKNELLRHSMKERAVNLENLDANRATADKLGEGDMPLIEKRDHSYAYGDSKLEFPKYDEYELSPGAGTSGSKYKQNSN